MPPKPEWAQLRRRPCSYCGNPFKPTSPDHRFCSPKCRRAWHYHGGSYEKLRILLEKRLAGIEENLDQKIRTAVAVALTAE